MHGDTAARLEKAREALAAAELSATAGSVGQATTGGGNDGELEDVEPGRVRPGGVAGQGPRSQHAREADPDAVARQLVLRQLTMGPRTRRQLSDKLKRRGCATEVIDRVLDRLSEVGLIDDRAYAQMLVRTRQETKGLAAAAISHELRRKGVADDLIDQALDGVDPVAEKEQARELVAKRLRTMHGLDREVQTRRLAAFLTRKGYGAGVCYDVIREALDTAPEHQRD